MIVFTNSLTLHSLLIEISSCGTFLALRINPVKSESIVAVTSIIKGIKCLVLATSRLTIKNSWIVDSSLRTYPTDTFNSIKSHVTDAQTSKIDLIYSCTSCTVLAVQCWKVIHCTIRTNSTSLSNQKEPLVAKANILGQIIIRVNWAIRNTFSRNRVVCLVWTARWTDTVYIWAFTLALAIRQNLVLSTVFTFWTARLADRIVNESQWTISTWSTNLYKTFSTYTPSIKNPHISSTLKSAIFSEGVVNGAWRTFTAWISNNYKPL